MLKSLEYKSLPIPISCTKSTNEKCMPKLSADFMSSSLLSPGIEDELSSAKEGNMMV